VRIEDNTLRDFLQVCEAIGVNPEAQLQALIIAFIAKHGDKLKPDQPGR